MKSDPMAGSTLMLRDYFAGQALRQVATPQRINEHQFALIAAHCYELADAMLKKREDSVT